MNNLYFISQFDSNHAGAVYIVCHIFIGYNKMVMLLEYLPIFIFLVFALIFAGIMLGIGFTFGAITQTLKRIPHMSVDLKLLKIQG